MAYRSDAGPLPPALSGGTPALDQAFDLVAVTDVGDRQLAAVSAAGVRTTPQTSFGVIGLLLELLSMKRTTQDRTRHSVQRHRPSTAASEANAATLGR
jgi:hypothetical protein